MSDIAVMCLVFLCVFGAAVLGFLLRRFLSEHHMATGTQDVVNNVAMGVIASMAALVLGLMVASMQGEFDAKASEVRSVVVNTTLLSRTMAHYKPDLAADRQKLQDFVSALKQRLWDANAAADPLKPLDDLREDIRKLNLQSDGDKMLQSRMLSLSDSLMYTADELVEAGNSSLPVALLVVVIVWLSVIFMGFGLFAPFNATTTGSLAIGAAAVSMAIFLIVTMDGPFSGVIQISQQGIDRAATEIASAR